MMQVFGRLIILAILVANSALADSGETPPSDPFPRTLDKIRSCGLILMRKAVALGMRTDDKEAWDEQARTAEWILEGKEMSPEQISRFIEVSFLSTRSTARILEAFKKRTKNIQRMQAGPDSVDVVVTEQEFLLFLVSLSNIRIEPEAEAGLVNLFTRYLPMAFSCLRGDKVEYERQRQLWVAQFYPALQTAEWNLSAAYFDALDRLEGTI